MQCIGLSQADAARALGAKRQSFGHAENGPRFVLPDRLINFAQVFGLDPPCSNIRTASLEG
ncbi:helix-turn-helix domain-containing protein [Singulisphaera sp. PoT]|uniref:helix-turn-helix domain-containing protein n=1 Tax=Singulisphaera sp. PoT TaxID=3411797 RepID=UPI003BF4CD8E